MPIKLHKPTPLSTERIQAIADSVTFLLQKPSAKLVVAPLICDGVTLMPTSLVLPHPATRTRSGLISSWTASGEWYFLSTEKLLKQLSDDELRFGFALAIFRAEQMRRSHATYFVCLIFLGLTMAVIQTLSSGRHLTIPFVACCGSAFALVLAVVGLVIFRIQLRGDMPAINSAVQLSSKRAAVGYLRCVAKLNLTPWYTRLLLRRLAKLETS